jgi:ABC-type spermidine/putrescine transport system permease subunit I
MTATIAQAPGRAFARRENRNSLLIATPTLLFLLVLFAYPVGRLMLLSLESGSLAHFNKALTDGLYLYVFYYTFRIALTVTALSLLLGYPVAHFLATASRGWATIGFSLVLLPFWTSLLVRTYAWMVLLGRNGVINRVLLDIGVISDPLRLLHNETGVLIGMVHVLMPYLVFPLYSVMIRVDRDLLTAAEGLGGTPFQIFRRVYFPLTLPGVVAGCALVFILSLGFFITPALLGGGRVIMIAVLIEQQVRELLNWGFAAALCVVLLVGTLAAYSVLNRVLRGDSVWH